MKIRPGFYIVFEGVVGSGKTTQSKKLAAFLKQKFPRREVAWTYEPGGTEIAETIRKAVQGTKYAEKMEPVCEAYLYAAARAQSLRRSVLPVLARGGIVVADRSFVTSLAFQGHARNLGTEKILEINKIAVEGANPDLIIYLALDPTTGLSRSHNPEGDKFENEPLQFFRSVDRGYQRIARLPLFKNKWLTVKAEGDIADVFYKILRRVIQGRKTLNPKP